ncbi:hypothetical protein ACFYYL_32840 [Actinomadura geliboluensis]|uniref:hypothetical protein n=1 Tax=Actinomadura geliboluensis TaxID=882440 RepID=UPI00367F756D
MSAGPARVAHLDLRDRDAAEAADLVAELLHTSQDLELLLVVDTAAAVVLHRAAFEALDASRQVSRLLCLVAGRPPAAPAASGADPAVLRLPSNIQRRALWVIEETGVDWPLRAAARARRRDGRDGDGLARLAELLRLPALFERTHRVLGEVPFGAAVPGLHLAGHGGTGHEDFLLALRAAIRRALDPASPAPPERADEQTRSRVPVRFTAGSALRRAFDEADGALAEAREAAVELPGAGALLRELPADAAVRDAGDRLGALRDRLADLFGAVPDGDRLTDDRRAAIAARGVEPPPPEPFEPRPYRDGLHAWLADGLHRGASLPRLDQDLRASAAALDGRGGHARRLRTACPGDLLDGLRAPAPMAPPQPWLPAAGAVAAALAGLSPLGVAGGLVMALLWTALVALTVLRGPGGRLADHSRALGLNAFGALAGAIGGGVAGDTGLPPAAWAAAVAVAVAGALAVIAQSWRSRAIRWGDETGLDRAEAALQDMRHLLGGAVTDWARLNRRLDVVDELNAVRQALAGVREELVERAAKLDADDHGRPARSPLRYPEAVQCWLGDLVAEAVRGAPHGERGEQAGPHVREAARRLLDGWEHAVERGHAPEAAPFVTDARPVPLIDAEDLAFAAEQAGHDPAGEMWQLCAPEDLALLDTAPEPRAVRFAPRSAGGAGALPAGTVAVPSAAHCGVLRLVPLHAGVVEWTWSEEDDGGSVEAGRDGRTA